MFLIPSVLDSIILSGGNISSNTLSIIVDYVSILPLKPLIDSFPLKLISLLVL